MKPPVRKTLPASIKDVDFPLGIPFFLHMPNGICDLIEFIITIRLPRGIGAREMRLGKEKRVSGADYFLFR